MYNADDAIRLLRTELLRLSGEFTFAYSYRLKNSDQLVSGVGSGHKDRIALAKHLEKYRPEKIDIQLTIY